MKSRILLPGFDFFERPFLLLTLALGIAPTAPAQLILDVQNTWGSTVLSVGQPPASQPEHRVYESAEATLRDRIELRIPVEVDWLSLDEPVNWQWQFQQVIEDTGPVHLATYFFAGSDGSSNQEFELLSPPLAFSFVLTDSSRPDDPYVLDLPVTVYTSVVIPGSGLLPSVFNESALVVVSPVPEPGTLGLLLVMGLLTGRLRRCRRALTPGRIL